MKAISAAILAAGLLAGCSATEYSMSNFGSTDPVEYRDPDTDNVFLIQDKPDQKRMQMLMGMGGTIGLLVVGGNAIPPLPLWESAAIKYLAKTGRTCTITRSFEILKAEIEVQYDCAAPAPAN